MCDIAHALILERVEGDGRARYVGAAVAFDLGADGMDGHEPEQARARFEDMLSSSESVSSGPARPAGISDDEWELRLALGVGTSGR